MWTCAGCGEVENEGHYKFCYTCGAPNPALDELSAGPTAEHVALTDPAEMPEERPHHQADSEHGFRLPKALTSLGQKLRQATGSAGGEQVISVRASPEAQEAVDLLLQAGRFDNQADAAGFLLEEGARAQSELLTVIRQKLSEIERLRDELRGIGERR